MKDIIDLIVKPLLSGLLSDIEHGKITRVSLFLILFFIIPCVIGGLFTWAFSVIKKKREIENASEDLQKKRFENLEKFHLYRKNYKESVEFCQLSVRACISSISENNVNELIKNRDNLIDFFFNDLCGKFIEYMDASEIKYNTKYEKMQFINSEIVSFINLCSIMIDSTNNPIILEKTKSDKCQISNSTVFPLVSYMKKSIPFYGIKKRWEMKSKINKISIGCWKQ
ncbi:hypothetical protein [Acetobacter sp.]|uniref:hypothetical protein n=1 Tax=Acetobacter sp. TaxID=440 RepID=UPI0039EB1EF5